MERAGPRTKGIPSWAHRSARQVPGEHAFDADHEIRSIGRHGLEERFGGRLQMPVQQDLTGLIQDANIEGVRVQVHATVELRLLGIEAPEVSSS
jgi:hypothetical protein